MSFTREPSSAIGCRIDLGPDLYANWTSQLTQGQDTSLADLPKDKLCSYCFMSLLRALQSTPYSNYDYTMADQFAAAQQGKSGYAFALEWRLIRVQSVE